VNDNILRMQDIQNSILGLSFNQMLPKTISDKVLAQLTPPKDDKDKGNGQGKFNGKKFPGGFQVKEDKQDLIYDNDKSHQHWKLKENENFSRTFNRTQKECPKTVDGRLVCMKFFLRGVCAKSCPRAHTLNKEDIKAFDEFVAECRAGAGKPDFR